MINTKNSLEGLNNVGLVSPDIFEAIAVSGAGTVAALRVTGLQNGTVCGQLL